MLSVLIPRTDHELRRPGWLGESLRTNGDRYLQPIFLVLVLTRREYHEVRRKRVEKRRYGSHEGSFSCSYLILLRPYTPTITHNLKVSPFDHRSNHFILKLTMWINIHPFAAPHARKSNVEVHSGSRYARDKR